MILPYWILERSLNLTSDISSSAENLSVHAVSTSNTVLSHAFFPQQSENTLSLVNKCIFFYLNFVNCGDSYLAAKLRNLLPYRIANALSLPAAKMSERSENK